MTTCHSTRAGRSPRHSTPSPRRGTQKRLARASASFGAVCVLYLGAALLHAWPQVPGGDMLIEQTAMFFDADVEKSVASELVAPYPSGNGVAPQERAISSLTR